MYFEFIFLARLGEIEYILQLLLAVSHMGIDQFSFLPIFGKFKVSLFTFDQLEFQCSYTQSLGVI
jgi:hypothetical protein